MLKGQVFSEQVFENQIFALFVDTFLASKCGIGKYGQNMNLSYSGSNVTIQSGVCCIRGRFVEEDSSTTLNAGTNALYCKLVIELDLDKTNTEESFLQGAYKIITSQSDYPNLTQTDIVKNNAGIYQFELARFRTGQNGITDFQDKREFLDFDSIYEEIREHIQAIDDESIFQLKPVVAYDNPTGTNQTIQLNDSAENYDYAEIFYKDEHALYNSVRVYKPDQKMVDLHSFHAYSQSNTVISDSSIVWFDGNKLMANMDKVGNRDGDTYGSWNSWNNTITGVNHIYITRVIFYN